MKWKSDFPGALGGPINYSHKWTFTLWWTTDVCLFKWPFCTFLSSLSHLESYECSPLIGQHLFEISSHWLRRVSSSSCTLSTQRRSKAHHHPNKVDKIAPQSILLLIRRDKNILLQVNFYIWHIWTWTCNSWSINFKYNKKHFFCLCFV